MTLEDDQPDSTPTTRGETVEQPEWTVDDSISTYNIDRWGLGYFSINEAGNVSISPLRDKGVSIDILAVLRLQDDGWWEAEISKGRTNIGAVGLVPSNYLQRC